jgi:hypothetical protein
MPNERNVEALRHALEGIPQKYTIAQRLADFGAIMPNTLTYKQLEWAIGSPDFDIENIRNRLKSVARGDSL